VADDPHRSAASVARDSHEQSMRTTRVGTGASVIGPPRCAQEEHGVCRVEPLAAHSEHLAARTLAPVLRGALKVGHVRSNERRSTARRGDVRGRGRRQRKGRKQEGRDGAAACDDRSGRDFLSCSRLRGELTGSRDCNALRLVQGSRLAPTTWVPRSARPGRYGFGASDCASEHIRHRGGASCSLTGAPDWRTLATGTRRGQGRHSLRACSVTRFTAVSE